MKTSFEGFVSLKLKVCFGLGTRSSELRISIGYRGGRGAQKTFLGLHFVIEDDLIAHFSAHSSKTERMVDWIFDGSNC